MVGSCLVACLGVAACSPSALTETVALERLRTHKSLPVAPEDLKVLGITEGETERIVKVDFAGNVANVKFRKFDQGWSPEQIETVGGSWLNLDTGCYGNRKAAGRCDWLPEEHRLWSGCVRRHLRQWVLRP